MGFNCYGNKLIIENEEVRREKERLKSLEELSREYCNKFISNILMIP